MPQLNSDFNAKVYSPAGFFNGNNSLSGNESSLFEDGFDIIYF